MFDLIKDTVKVEEEPEPIIEESVIEEEPPKKLSWMSMFKKPSADEESKPKDNEF